MAVRDRPNVSLIENLITLLAYDDHNGQIVANMVDTSLFDGEYRLIGERLVEYWQGYGTAPKAHTADLFSEILEDASDRRSKPIRRILLGMLHLAEAVNTDYVLDQLRTFNRMQRLKEVILKSAERLNSRQELAIDEVEAMWSDLLRVNEERFDSGLRLSDIERVVASIVSTSDEEFVTGIPELDRRGVVPRRKEAMLMIGAKGMGKSWACVQIGKHAMLRRKKVLHVSLEMGEEQVARRYYQALYSVPRRDNGKVRVATLTKNGSGRVEEINTARVQPDFALSSPFLRDELEHHSEWLGTRSNNLLIKRFPTRKLTVPMLEGYLDSLEVGPERFIPDMLILDYIGIMNTDAKDHRISLGRAFEDIRGILVQRNMAGFIPHQGQRAAANATLVTSSHVAEDWSLVHTADQVLTLSATKAEKRLGLARMHVAHSRDEGDGFGALLVQNYDIGQFCLDSAFLPPDYFDLLKDAGLDDDEDDEPGYDQGDS